MEFVATFIVLAIGGIADAGYLAYKHRQKKPLACPLDHDCSHVTESKWAAIFGVRNDILGLLYYVGMLGGILLMLTVPVYAGILRTLLMVGASLGLIFSAFLTVIQFTTIKDYCFYCLISAGLNLLLFINMFAL